jgi:transposase
MSERKPYPSDLSDEQWPLIEPVITAWKDRHRSVSGYQGAYEMREIVNAILIPGADRLPVGLSPARPAAEERDVLLLRHLAGRRNRPGHPRVAALPGP